MANAKKLTEPQIAALRDAAKTLCGYRPRHSAGYGRSTIEALRTRGLLGNYRSGTGYEITPAGRHALFEATGDMAAAAVIIDAGPEHISDVVKRVQARLGAGLQANGRPGGHGGGCNCSECRAVEGP